MTPAYHRKEGVAHHLVARKHSLLYGRRPGGRFGVQAGMWNIGCLSGKGGEVCVEKEDD